MFKTARTHPKMVLINMALDGNDAVKLSAPDMSELQVKVPEYSENNKYSHCKFWGNEMLGTVDCGDMAAKWLSQYMLGKDNGVRLGYHLADIMPRRVADKNLKHCYKTLQDSDLGAYSDLSSFMLMTESSIADLKTRVPPDVSVVPRQFRPNFLVRASVAYEEDKWDWIRIGDTAVFRNVKPCTRCLFTTVDPNTGIKNPHKEPLSTLKRYRKLTDPTKLKVEGSAPAFGINLGLHRKGIIRVGDNVFVGTE
ncbi:mitochondrial amidoxime-reducing component 1-like isoform X2 [Zootermopsis nevadensis]|nr:mitochondrial amidoxime-reducing component 1-like isoform X2 [Zootermopsis nevadensis]XP_021919376.1 mitochondrial amidoxime-reducing component 1-like isoform X2 [Zootermopsis nevadensis]